MCSVILPKVHRIRVHFEGGLDVVETKPQVLIIDLTIAQNTEIIAIESQVWLSSGHQLFDFGPDLLNGTQGLCLYDLRHILEYIEPPGNSSRKFVNFGQARYKRFKSLTLRVHCKSSITSSNSRPRLSIEDNYAPTRLLQQHRCFSGLSDSEPPDLTIVLLLITVAPGESFSYHNNGRGRFEISLERELRKITLGEVKAPDSGPDFCQILQTEPFQNRHSFDWSHFVADSGVDSQEWETGAMRIESQNQ
ncbi:hypothetical protein C8R43DRAFT_957749 [Mycena crocata]|nr:hypothetical protein C8R43DRAFT_957749 [Mycena crocata]